LGLLLITLGAGGIKSSVSANVGDQFGPRNKHLLEKVFGWFYFSINFGSFFSTLMTPVLLDHFSRADLYGRHAKHLGPAVAFGVPGVLMITATLVFWLGRKKFVHIPPSGSTLMKEAFQSGRGHGHCQVGRAVPFRRHVLGPVRTDGRRLGAPGG